MDAPLNLPDGLTARAAASGDVRAVFELVSACEAAVQGEADVALEDVAADWRRPSFDLQADSLVVLESERVVAEAEVFRGRRAEANVHPDAQGRGIGAQLVAWTERRARETGGALVGQTVPDANERAALLLRSRGYRPLWHSWVLSLRLRDEPPEPPTLPVGYAFRPFAAGIDDREVYEVVERAFGEWPDRDPFAYEDWRATALEVDGFDPAMMLLVVRGGEIVGVANLQDLEGEGWVHQLAVAREHRRSGLGRAMLQRSFELFHERGKGSVGLSTDSRTGALGWYERAGMRVVRSYTHHAKEL